MPPGNHAVEYSAAGRYLAGMTTVNVDNEQVDGELVRKAEAVLRPMGMSTRSVIERLFARIAENEALPFELFEPNAETVAAMEAADRGEFVTVGSIDDLFADLHADD
jgi:DNA-damage-inducible protein J